MNRSQLLKNLDTLCGDLSDYGRNKGRHIPADAPSGLCSRLFLSHSMADAKLPTVCGSGVLLSASAIAANNGTSVPVGCSEAQLGTAAFVFFYVAPFRYPNTGCGFLFSAELEETHRADGVCSPFDSGGLVKHLIRRDPSEPPIAFLNRHELPVPEHRRYLDLSMQLLFASPGDYLTGDPSLPGPIGLSGGDRRRWTHEVRIPDRVELRGGHLEAVFARRTLVIRERSVRELFQWCSSTNVSTVPLESSRADDYNALQTACIEYIREKLY